MRRHRGSRCHHEPNLDSMTQNRDTTPLRPSTPSFYQQRILWGMSVACGWIAIAWGNTVNHHQRKYAPTNETSCPGRAFVNMMAASAQEVGAVVCCETNASWPEEDEVCRTRLYWSHRLSKMPTPMLLPLLPILWRFGNHTTTTDSYPQMGTRLLLYIGICYVRYYIAYRILNVWEDAYVTVEDECWYRDYRPTCFGRAFDFSDHIVLYYGQLSPIVTAEVAHQGWYFPMLLYWIGLHYLIFHGTFVTAAYFHTNEEVYVGYLVSLFVSAPLFYWQGKQWFPFRR